MWLIILSHHLHACVPHLLSSRKAEQTPITSLFRHYFTFLNIKISQVYFYAKCSNGEDSSHRTGDRGLIPTSLPLSLSSSRNVKPYEPRSKLSHESSSRNRNFPSFQRGRKTNRYVRQEGLPAWLYAPQTISILSPTKHYLCGQTTRRRLTLVPETWVFHLQLFKRWTFLIPLPGDIFIFQRTK